MAQFRTVRTPDILYKFIFFNGILDTICTTGVGSHRSDLPTLALIYCPQYVTPLPHSSDTAFLWFTYSLHWLIFWWWLEHKGLKSIHSGVSVFIEFWFLPFVFPYLCLSLSPIYIKVMWSRYRPGMAQRMGRGIALLFHYRGTRRGWVFSSTPRPHFTPGKDPVPILQEAEWAPGTGLDGWKIWCPPGFDPGPSSPQSVAIPTELPGPYIYIYI